MTYQLTSLGIGLALAVTILVLVRRAHLHGPNALWWLALAGGIVILGTWPRATDLIAPYLGVSYPPIVVILFGLALLLIKMMSMDLQCSRQEQRIRRLAQRLAMLEAQLGSGIKASSDQTLAPKQRGEPATSSWPSGLDELIVSDDDDGRQA